MSEHAPERLAAEVKVGPARTAPDQLHAAVVAANGETLIRFTTLYNDPRDLYHAAELAADALERWLVEHRPPGHDVVVNDAEESR